MSDRLLGYAVIFFLLIFAAGIAVYLSMQALSPAHYRTIVFDSAQTHTLNFLRDQDQVNYRGVQCGQVTNIYLENGKTYVKIRINRNIEIHQGYTVVADVKGFMGNRYIEIFPGDPRAPVITSNETLTGTFPMGPAEAVAYTAQLKTKMRSLLQLTDELIKGAPGKTPLNVSFTSLTKKSDSITLLIEGLLKQVECFASQNALPLAEALRNTNEASKKLNATVPATVVLLENITTKTKNLLIAADSLEASCSLILARLTSVKTGTNFIKLRKQLEELMGFITEIKKEGVRLPVRL